MEQIDRRSFVQGLSAFAAVLGTGLSVGLKVKPETPTTSIGHYITVASGGSGLFLCVDGRVL